LKGERDGEREGVGRERDREGMGKERDKEREKEEQKGERENELYTPGKQIQEAGESLFYGKQKRKTSPEKQDKIFFGFPLTKLSFLLTYIFRHYRT
jgi:hypothetical protein